MAVPAEPSTKTEDCIPKHLEISRYLLEMLLQMSRLAARAGESDLARDLELVRTRAESRKRCRLN